MTKILFAPSKQAGAIRIALGLPPETVAIDFRMRVNEAASVTAEIMVDTDKASALASVLRQFKLVPIDRPSDEKRKTYARVISGGRECITTFDKLIKILPSRAGHYVVEHVELTEPEASAHLDFWI